MIKVPNFHNKFLTNSFRERQKAKGIRWEVVWLDIILAHTLNSKKKKKKNKESEPEEKQKQPFEDDTIKKKSRKKKNDEEEMKGIRSDLLFLEIPIERIQKTKKQDDTQNEGSMLESLIDSDIGSKSIKIIIFQNLQVH